MLENLTFKGCIPTVIEMIEAFGKNQPFGRSNESVNFYNFLKSQDNTSGFLQISAKLRSVIDGKFVKMEFMSTKPMCLAICEKDFTCSPAQIPYSAPITYHEFELNKRHVYCDANGDEQVLTINRDTFLEYCSVSQRNIFKEQQLEYLKKLPALVNKSLVKDLAMLIDTTNPLVTPVLVRTVDSKSLALKNDWLLNINKLIEKKGYMADDYILLGGTMVQALEITGGNVPFKMFYDKNFDENFSASGDMFVLIPKGTFQVGEYSYFENSPVVKENIVKNFTLVPTGNGVAMPIDYVTKEIESDNCTTFTYAPAYSGQLIKAVSGDCADSNNDGIIVVKNCGLEILSC